jgi:GTP-binding protein EngB required for normal cell division
MYTIEMVSEV